MALTLQYNLVMHLHDLFSNSEAAAHLGMGVDEFRFDERITGIPVGERQNRFTGQPEPLTWVYTRRMLDDYANGRFPIKPNEDELRSVLSTEQAADVLGVATTAVSQRVYRGTLPSKKVGKVRVFLRWDIEQAIKADTFVNLPPGFAQTLATWRQGRKLSLTQAEDVLPISREYIRQIEAGELTAVTQDVYERMMALMLTDLRKNANEKRELYLGTLHEYLMDIDKEHFDDLSDDEIVEFINRFGNSGGES